MKRTRAPGRSAGRDQRLEDGDGLDVRPVVQDPLQDVDICLYGLGVEEVVRLEGDARFEILREFALEDGRYLGEILDDDGQVGICLCQCDVVVTS